MGGLICTVGGLIPGAVFGFDAPGRLTSIGAAFRAGGADIGDDPTIGSEDGAEPPPSSGAEIFSVAFARCRFLLCLRRLCLLCVTEIPSGLNVVLLLTSFARTIPSKQRMNKSNRDVINFLLIDFLSRLRAERLRRLSPAIV